MKNIYSLLERLFLVLVFCAIVALFWVITYQQEYLHSPMAYAQKMLVAPLQPERDPATTLKKVLFTPDQDIKKAIIGLMDAEKESIAAAVYMFTEKDIAHAMVNAHKRGVKVELITDPSCALSPYCKAAVLSKHGIPVYVYTPPLGANEQGRSGSLMHDKFFIFNNSMGYKKVVCTGSYNSTKSASYSNQENFLFIEDAPLADDYLKQFEVLKTRSRRY